MQVDITVTEDDVWRFTRRASWRHRTLRVTVLGNVLAAMLVTAGATLAAGLPVPAVVLAATAVAPLTWWLHWATTRRRTLRLIPDGVLGDHTLTVSSAALHERTTVNDSTTAWSAITEVDRDEHAVYLHVGPLQAHIVPLRCFANDGEAARFEQEARRYATSRSDLVTG